MIGEKEYGTPITQLPYKEGDTVYAFDLHEHKFIRCEVIMIGVMKKAEWKQIKLTLRDVDSGEEMRRSLDRTIWVETSLLALKKRVFDALEEAKQAILRMPTTGYKRKPLNIFDNES